MHLHQLPHRARTLCVRMFAAAALPASVVDCDVSVFDAYQKAKGRGWQFACERLMGLSHVGITANFVTYPPTDVGCVFKTPMVVTGALSLGYGQLFESAEGSSPTLRQGWSVVSFEIAGGQWTAPSALPARDVRARVNFSMTEAIKPNRTYNVRVKRLTLRKNTGNCSKAIDEAF